MTEGCGGMSQQITLMTLTCKGSIKILVPVMDYDGMAMFHCHILEHEDIGMMGVWDIMGEM